MENDLKKVFSYIDKNADKFVERLREAVKIPSVSAWPKCRQDVVKMMEHAAKELEK